MKITIGGLFLTIGLMAMSPSISPGAAAEDPCGGRYAGEGLKAVFLSPDCAGAPCNNVFNDIPGLYYHYGVGAECVYLYRAGHILLSVDTARNGRYVGMRFEGNPLSPQAGATDCAPNPYFRDQTGLDQPRSGGFFFRTTAAYNWSRDALGKLTLRPAGVVLNLGAMQPGQTAYCDIWWDFHVSDLPVDDPNDPLYGLDESADTYKLLGQPVKVYYGDFGGIMRWVITPITEPFDIRIETKVRKAVQVTVTSYSDSLWRTLISNGRSLCTHGTYYLPFELTFERLN